MKATRTRVLCLLLLLLSLLPLSLAPLRAGAQEGMAYARFDVDITLNDDATFTVRAIQSIRFDGEYNFATLEIPMLDRAAAIDVLAVGECLDAACESTEGLEFSTSEESPILFVEWEYADSSAGEERTFVVEYQVRGGLWVYEDRDALVWPAIPAGRSGLPVEGATVTLNLPDGAADAIEAEVLSGNGSAEVEGSTVTFDVDTPLEDGQPFEISVLFRHGLVPATMQPWQREAEEEALEVAVDAVDVTVAFNSDGSMRVREDLTFAVSMGTLFGGYRSLSQLFMDGVDDVTVAWEGEPLLPAGDEACENCFRAAVDPGSGSWIAYNPATGAAETDENAADRLELDWWISPGVSAGNTARFTVEYTVQGGLRISDTAQIANLEIIPDYDTRVAAADLRIIPPTGISADQVRVESGSLMSEPTVMPDGSLLLTNLDLPETRPRWQVEITLPANATTAQPPAWQLDFEQAVAEASAAATAQARREVGAGVAGVGATLAAAAGGVWAWLRFGRKKARARAAGYTADPPSDLAPGIVAYLMDRSASERGVLASLFHLATAGALEIDLKNGIQLRRRVEGPLTTASRIPPTAVAAAPAGAAAETVRLEDHQLLLYNEVLLPNVPTDSFVTLDSIAGPLRAHLPALFAEMGQDAQQYFLSPGGSSGGPGCLELAGIAALIIGGGALVLWLDVGGFASFLLYLALGSLVALWIAVRAMRPSGARRSATGEQEAQRWGLFKNYLTHLQEFGDLAAAQEIIDRHFAYAVALGVEEVVLKQAEAMGGSMPPWMWVPTTPRPPMHQQGFPQQNTTQQPLPQQGLPQQTTLPSAGLPSAPVGVPASGSQGPRPSLSGMSSGMGSSLSSGSGSLARTLSVAAGATAATVVLKSRLQDRTMQWAPDASPATMLDDIMKSSMSDAQTIRTRPPTTSGGSSRPSGGGGGGPTWGSGFGGGGSSQSRGSGRSSGGFSSRPSSGSRPSSSSSRPSSSRSSGSRSSGRSGGFGKR